MKIHCTPSAQPVPNESASESARPKPREPLLLQTPAFRCAGFLDVDGRWKDRRGRELPEVIGWEPL